MQMYIHLDLTRTITFAVFIGVAFAGILGVTAISAAEDRLSGFPSLVLGGQTATATFHQFEKPFDNQIVAGSFKISLEETDMHDIREAFGGTLQSRSLSDAAASWLCYEMSADNLKRRIWFVAEGTGHKPGDAAIVNFVSTELVNDHIAGCDAPKVDLTAIVLPVPTLKDDWQVLEKRFGPVSKEGLVRYSNNRANQNGKTTVQSLVYRLRNGKIDAIAFSQVTSPH